MKNPECSCDRRFLYGKELYDAGRFVMVSATKASERAGGLGPTTYQKV